MYKLICITVLILASLTAAFGQTEVLTNKTVVDMVAAGLGSDIIIKKIKTTQTDFNVTAEGLIDLKTSKVPDDVIKAMIDRQELLPKKAANSTTPDFAASETKPNALANVSSDPPSKKEILTSAKTIAIEKSSLQPSRQALEKELMKRPTFEKLGLTIERYKDSADLYIEIGYVSMSWITHRYVYRIYDRRSGAVIAAGETTSWGSLAENLAKHIDKDLAKIIADTGR